MHTERTMCYYDRDITYQMTDISYKVGLLAIAHTIHAYMFFSENRDFA